MQSRTTRGLGLLLGLTMGCGSTQALAPGGGGALAVHQDTGEPHVFTARVHPPRQRARAASIQLASMPKLVDRSAQCFDYPEPEKIATRPRRPSKSAKKKSGFVPFSPSPSAPGTPASTTKPSPRTKSSGHASSPKPTSVPTSPPPEPSVVATAPAAEEASPADASGADFEDAPRSESIEVRAPRDSGAERRASRKAEREQKRRSRGKQDMALAQASEAPVVATPQPAFDDRFDDWGRATYLSNDDSMSLSSAQRVIFAIDRFLPLPLAHIRPHELLNYFSFETAPVPDTDDFSVEAQIAPDPNQPGIYNLALAVAGRQVDRDARRNAALTIVVDRSGSMADEGRMEYLKRGMHRMLDELKNGDSVHIVLFDDQVCTPIENFVVGRDPRRVLEKVIDRMAPRGSTDVNAGLQTGYAIADRSFVPDASNRVLLVTDALANTGVTDESTMALVAKHYDSRRIRLSGIGVGTEFNDSLLDQLTEKGRGAYVFLGSEAEVDAVFGSRFVSLVETVANDVHFQLHLPPSLRMNVFYGEESSAVKEDVQAIHYFANTQQLFLSDLMARGGTLRPQDGVMLTVEYEDPETGDDMVEEFAFTLGEIGQDTKNVKKGRYLIRFVDALASMAARPLPNVWSADRGAWQDEGAVTQCEQVRGDLQGMAAGMDGDAEVRRVLGLWDRHCLRFDRARQPTRRASPENGWPAASG